MRIVRPRTLLLSLSVPLLTGGIIWGIQTHRENQIQAHIDRGIVFLKKGHLPEAVSAFTFALKLDPKSTSALEQRGVAHGMLGKYELAIDDFSHALSLDPRNPRIFFNRAMAHSELGNDSQAVDDYTRSSIFSPSYPAIYYQRGLIFANRGVHKKAIQDFTAAIYLTSKQPQASFYKIRGDSLQALGETSSAEKDWKQAKLLEQRQQTRIR